MNKPGEPGRPSPFYDLVDAGTPHTLIVCMDPRGDAVIRPPGDAEPGESCISALELRILPLGGGRYRLCESNPFMLADLFWGDEFFAEERKPGELRLTGFPPQQRYGHTVIMLSGPLDPDGFMAATIHRLEGGWETFEMGMLVVTLPLERWEEFEAATGALDDDPSG